MNVVVLGSTGSIGKNTMDVTKNLSDVRVYGLSVNRNIGIFRKQIEEFKPKKVVITDADTFRKHIKILKENYGGSTKVLSGVEGLGELMADEKVDVVINGLSGIAALKPTLLALDAGKKVALANKESIVMGWDLIKKRIK